MWDLFRMNLPRSSIPGAPEATPVLCSLLDYPCGMSDWMCVSCWITLLIIGNGHVKISCLIKDNYIEFNCAAYIAGKTGEWFVAQRGVRQSATFSMKLYQEFKS